MREALGLLFNFEWSNAALFYDTYQRMTSFWENTDLAARGVPTPEEAAILQPLVDEGLLPESILTDEAVVRRSRRRTARSTGAICGAPRSC